MTLSAKLYYSISELKSTIIFNKSSWTTLTKEDKKLMQDENHAATGFTIIRYL